MSNVDKNYEDFLKSLQEDNSGTQESFPFSEDFDIENFIKATETPAQEPVLAPAPTQNTPIQIMTAKPEEQASEQAYTESTISFPEENNQQINFETEENKDYSIKRLEEKLNDLQQKFDETNNAKEEESAFASELNKIEDEPKTEPVKSDEEFFSNVSSAIQNLKGSLDNIVNTRLRYEENLIRQDQTLIARLKEKTTRLKAINLALNSEVKRSRNEKLEYLRRSAEQTKELLSLRMQLSHAEERTKQSDFKISGLEQQITLLTQEKGLLDEEIAKIRQEKLDYLQSSTEQTKNIMELRHKLTAAEEALKQEEVKTNFLEQQLKAVETAHQVLQTQNQNSDLQRGEIESLTNQLAQSRRELAQKTQEATNLREQLLNLHLSPGQNKDSIAAFAVKQEEILAPLKLSQQEHEQKIAMLRAEQSAELQRLRTKTLQEENLLREELQKAEEKYYQEQSRVNSLKAQINTLENNLKNLEQEKADYKNKSDNLTKELDSIKDNNRNELLNLREALQKAQNSYDRQQELYNNLETQYKNAQREKYYLSEEIKKTITQRDNALLENERYLSEIERLKNSQNTLTQDLKQEIQQLLATKNQITNDIYALKQKAETPYEEIRKNQNYLQEKNTTLEILKTQMATLLNSKENIDKSLLEAREEKIKLLNELETRTSQLNNFQINYQNEIASLRQEKLKAQIDAETRIKDLEERLIAEQKTIYALNQQIQAAQSKARNLQTDENLAEERTKTRQLSKELEKAQKIFTQDTILLEELKNQYAKLQSRNELLEQELLKAKEENKQIEQERRNYKIQVTALGQQLQALREEIKQGQEFTKTLTAQVSKLKTINIALNAALKQMQEQKIEALNKTAQQTKDILELKEQLKRVQEDAKLNFTNGTVTVKQEYEDKIRNLEEELKNVSEICKTQIQEINKIKTDNSHLKTVAEEKLLLQNRFNALQRNLTLMTGELRTYKDNNQNDAIIKAKAAALTVQLERANKEKEDLKQQLENAKTQLKSATERERAVSLELETLRQTLNQNENNISRLKEEIAPLTQKIQEETKQQEPANLVQETAAENNLKDVMTDIPQNTQNQENTSTENKEATTRRDILAEYEEDEKNQEEKDNNTFSILDETKSIQPLEEVYLPEQEADLENLFKDDEKQNTVNNSFQEDGKIVVEEVKPTNVTQMMNSSKKIQDTGEAKPQISTSDNTFTDHSIRRSVINRRQHVRNPITTFQKDEEYSDFLKKTKSLFYRIKWSLFKD